MKNLSFSIVVFMHLCCNTQNEIHQLIKGNSADNFILASYKIRESRDTLFLAFLLNDLNDGRITNDVRFKGMSVYQSKVIALKKISGLSPPAPLTYRPDSINIKFYLEWYANKKRGADF